MPWVYCSANMVHISPFPSSQQSSQIKRALGFAQAFFHNNSSLL